ncbi:hypothetical protein PoB_005494300 [Plakobranchus ocellatus]|uniref:Uncharacterized protein n=1 Tax=Plakobranchus ocellatus TaxID=259542 RepID=A0AAV4CBT5_9GAST|nr:hypothetical protein PoB_005494300 [Plakobranchus ocellatus]
MMSQSQRIQMEIGKSCRKAATLRVHTQQGNPAMVATSHSERYVRWSPQVTASRIELWLAPAARAFFWPCSGREGAVPGTQDYGHPRRWPAAFIAVTPAFHLKIPNTAAVLQSTTAHKPAKQQPVESTVLLLLFVFNAFYRPGSPNM